MTTNRQITHTAAPWAYRNTLEEDVKNRISLSRIVLAFIAVVFSFVASLAMAQTNEGQLAGTVLDSTGAEIANAAISAKNEATGSVYSSTSTSSGSYRFPSISLGRYTITTTATGFKPIINTGVEVRVGTVTAFDVHLTIGGASDTITVASDAPSVETQSSEVGGTVTTQQIVDLPLALGGVGAMRSAESFVFLIPGTAGPGTGNSNNGVFISKIGGGQNFGNEVLLDGASQTRSENGSSFDEEAPSVEAIAEFKITTSTPAAEFGRTTGGIENFVTKSGTNSFHGTAFDIFRNDALDANQWFNNGRQAYYKSINDLTDYNNNARPSDKQNDFGGSFGGPVFIPHVYNGKDKSFFFFAWEQFRQTLGGVATSTVPTLAERGGDFSDQLIGGPTKQNSACDGSAIQNGEIFDPATTRTVNGTQCRSPFITNGKLNVIPQARFSPLASKILAYYPLPTNNALTNNYSLRSSSPINNTTYTVRIDHSIGANDKVYGSYNSRENTRHSPTFLTLPAPVDPSVQTQDFITHFGRAGWDHIFSPSVLNHLNLGFNRSNSINGSIEALSGVNYAQQLGIPNIVTGFPVINISGEQTLSRNQLGDNIDNGIRLNDSVSWQKGRNSFKFGFDYRYQQYSALANDQINGYFNFDGNQTKAAFSGPTLNGTGLGLASFLLGNFDSAGTTIPSHQPRWISAYYAGFVQDDFKVSNNLVLNIGLRYDVDQPRKEATNSTSNFSETAIDPKSGLPGALIFGTNCTNCNKRWAATWFKDFAPRIGFAYTLPNSAGKSVLRGGFSTLYGPLQYSDFGGSTITGYSNPINQNTNGFDASYRIDNGLNPYTVGTNLDPGYYDNGNSAAPVAFSNYIKSSYGRPAQVNQWNLQIQQELAKDLIMTVGYLGSSGAHLKSSEENINNSSKATFALGDILSRQFNFSAPAQGTKAPYAAFNQNAAYVQALRPFPQYDFIATDCCLQNVGHSSYEALIVSVERRFSQGLNLQASYTWSKTITNADSAINVTNGVAQDQDPADSKSQKSLSNQDIPHTFVVSYLYQLPFGKNKHFLNHGNPVLVSLISGFELGGVQRYQSGQPTSFGCADGIPGFQNCIKFTRLPGSQLKSNARHGKINPFRQLYAGGNLPAPDPNVDSEFNGLFRRDNAAYSALQPTPALYSQNESANRVLRAKVACAPDAATPNCDNGDFEFGNVPRVTGEARNYLYTNEDFSFLKKTPIGDNKTLILKVEALNAFNRHVFSTPDLNPYDSTFGVPSGVINGARSLQLTARVQF
ncbi:TonB-dependent receptor [Granulicella arctica]|uniref:TonB-dependent receptor n=1 Tax=Granulicella arctica TaxID=940613 RepID=UPI0021E03769|nr:TonB-dependent receptor [Granulicella arctica]